MLRSLSFTIEGEVDTLVTITELESGELKFEIAVASGVIGDLRAVFFDLNDLTADDSLYVSDAVDVTDSAFEEDGVDTLGKDANIKGAVSNELGDFDVGIEFGTSGMAADDIQSTSFVLGSTTTDLTLDMLSLADFGLRYTSVGEEGGDRTGSAKIGDQSNAAAQNDALTVEEGQTGAVLLLANDAAATGATVTSAETEAGAAFTAGPGGLTADIVIGGEVYGTVVIAADGTATVSADGAAAEALADGDVVVFSFGYTSTAPDGATATAMATVTITGVGGFFTEGDDVVDFNAVLAGDYTEGEQYDALAGNDRVTLAANAAEAAEAGYDPTVTFAAGAGDDTIVGGALSDLIAGGDGDDRIELPMLDAGDVIDGGADDDTLVFSLEDGITNDFLVVAAGPLSATDVFRLNGADIDVTNVENFHVTGGSGRDVVNLLLGGNDTVFGGAGNDAINTGAGIDIVVAGDGNDQVVFGGGGGSADGGAGFDTFDYRAAGDLFADMSTGVATSTIDGASTFVNFEVLTGFHGDDTLIGDGGNNQLGGNGGANLIDAAGGNDFIFIQSFNAGDTVDGGDGHDVLALLAGNNGTVTDFVAGTTQIVGRAVNRFSNIEQFQAQNGADTVFGDDSRQVLRLDGGDNWVAAAGGDDSFELSFGNHTIDGGAGHDTAFFNISDALTVDLAAGTAVSAVGSSTLTDVEGIIGGHGGDTLLGSGAAESLAGAGGDNLIDGRGGNDTLNGGAGDDTITGGAGDDEMNGGGGLNLFVFAPGEGADRIVGFDAGPGVADVIDLSAFSFADFAAVLAAATNEVGGVVIDLDGAPGGDQVQLHGLVAASLDADDFIL